MPEASAVPLGTAVQRVVGGLVVLVVAGVVFAPRMSSNAYDVASAGVGLGAVTLFSTLVWVLSKVVPRRRTSPSWMWDWAAAALCALEAVIGGVFAYAGAYQTTWDPQVVERAAAHPSGADVVAHFSIYPNMRPFLALARTVRSWTAGSGVDYDAAFSALNTVSFLLTATVLYVTVRRFASPARGVLALLVLGVLVDTSPWLSVPYTDLPVLWTPITAIALFAAAQRPGRIARSAILAAAGGAVLALGYIVKVTPVVGLVALIVTLAITATGRGRQRRRLLALGVSAVAAFLLTVPALGLWTRAEDGLPPLNGAWAATPLTYVAEGFRTQRSIQGGPLEYGAFDRLVVERTKRKDAATQNALAWQFIRQEWQRRGIAGTVRFEVDKTLFNWGDGMFWARGEGLDATAPALRHGPLADTVMTWNAPAGRRYPQHVLLAQITWTAALLALGIGLIRSRFRPEFLLMALTILGIAGFTLLFQGRSRYLLVHVPVVVALAASALPGPRAARPPRPGDATAGASRSSAGASSCVRVGSSSGVASRSTPATAMAARSPATAARTPQRAVRTATVILLVIVQAERTRARTSIGVCSSR